MHSLNFNVLYSQEQLQETNARINRIMFDPSPGQAAGTQMENNRSQL